MNDQNSKQTNGGQTSAQSAQESSPRVKQRVPVPISRPSVTARQVKAQPAQRQDMPPVRRTAPQIPQSAPGAKESDQQKTRKITSAEMSVINSSRPVAAARSQSEPAARSSGAIDADFVGNSETRQMKTVSPAGPRKNARTPGMKNGRPGNNDSESKKNKGEFGRGVVNNSVKAVIYIVCVLVVSGFLSLFAIMVGNDVFAFVKDSAEITVTIPEGASLGDIAEILGDNGVIKYPSMFKLYINLRKKGADEYLSGDFTVSPSMPYDTLISTFKKAAAARTEITITFTEGMTVDEIVDRFVENGIGTRERFIDVIQNYDFDYWFVKELDELIAKNPNSGRRYRLEGYLFPDTYNFFSDSTEEKAISRLLDNFNKKFDENYRLTARQMGFTCDEIVTLASMIQKEAKFNNDYPLVSSVFHNRLKNTSVTGGKLESNATVQYTMPKEEVQLALSLEDIEKYDNAYNTYKYEGLPVGPICNPSLNALYFSLYPQDSGYYYFISDSSGFNLYARTWQEHQKNRQKVESESGT